MSDEEKGVEEVTEEVQAGEPVAATDEAKEAEPMTAYAPSISPMASEPAPSLPPRRPTGLIVVVGSILLLLVLALVFWQPLFGAVNKLATGNGGATTTVLVPSKAKITATIGFVEAYMNADLLKMKPFLSNEAQAAATDAQWQATAALMPSATVTFADPVFSSDTTAQVTFSAGPAMTGTDTTGTLTFGYSETQPLVVTMLFESSGSADSVSFNLLAVGSEWRIVGESSASGGGNYDADFVKTIVGTATVPVQ